MFGFSRFHIYCVVFLSFLFLCLLALWSRWGGLCMSVARYRSSGWMSPNIRLRLECVEESLQHLQTFSHTSWFWDCLVIFWGCLTLYECSLLRYSHGFKLQLGFNVILVIMGNYGKMPLIYVVVIGIAVSENPLSL